MKDHNKVDLGSIKIHKKVIADVAANAVSEIKGVTIADKNIYAQVLEFLGVVKHPGIRVTVDNENQVTIDIAIWIHYGLSVPDVAAQTQDAVRDAIDQTIDIDLKDVNINIQGIERGSA